MDLLVHRVTRVQLDTQATPVLRAVLDRPDRQEMQDSWVLRDLQDSVDLRDR